MRNTLFLISTTILCQWERCLLILGSIKVLITENLKKQRIFDIGIHASLTLWQVMKL